MIQEGCGLVNLGVAPILLLAMIMQPVAFPGSGIVAVEVSRESGGPELTSRPGDELSVPRTEGARSKWKDRVFRIAATILFLVALGFFGIPTLCMTRKAAWLLYVLLLPFYALLGGVAALHPGGMVAAAVLWGGGYPLARRWLLHTEGGQRLRETYPRWTTWEGGGTAVNWDPGIDWSSRGRGSVFRGGRRSSGSDGLGGAGGRFGGGGASGGW